MATATRSDREREETARRGDDIYERAVRPRLGPEDEGKFVLIDVESGDHEMDRDEVAASDRLLARHPEARVWMLQVGSRYARRFGPRFNMRLSFSGVADHDASLSMQPIPSLSLEWDCSKVTS